MDCSLFPSNLAETLALEYVRSRDLSEETAADIVHIYLDAYKVISTELRRNYEDNRFAGSDGI